MAVDVELPPEEIYECGEVTVTAQKADEVISEGVRGERPSEVLERFGNACGHPEGGQGIPSGTGC